MGNKWKRRDGNHDALRVKARKKGALWIDAANDEKTGFDAYCGYRGYCFPVEIKNGNLSPSKRRLTDNEQARKKEFNDVGIPFVIWHDEHQMFFDLTLLEAGEYEQFCERQKIREL